MATTNGTGLVRAEQALLQMPFDQYGRYRMVQEAVQTAAQALGLERLRILDVGGYYQEADGTPRLPSQQFLGEHDLLVLDLPPCDLPGYVQGDGTQLTFPDNSFDLVISCDTLEHIPPALRDRFIGELARVARYGVVLICPIDSYATQLSEKVLFAYIQAELHARHDQLTEHREYGLPQIPLVRRAFAQNGCNTYDYPSGDLHAWLPMMLAKHYLMRFAQSEPELQYGLDELYNRSYAFAERREPSYRRLVIAAKQNTNGWLEAVANTLEPTVSRDADPRPEAWYGLAPNLLNLIQLGLGDRREEWRAQMLQQYIEGQRQHVSNLDRILADQQMHDVKVQDRIATLEQHIINLQHHIMSLQQQSRERESQLEQHIADLEQRARWLESQAQAARDQLAAVEHGIVMRVLRRMGR